MTRPHLSILALILAGLISNLATAQEEEGLTVTGGLGFHHFDGNRLLQNEMLWSIGAGYRFDNPFAVELHYMESDPAGEDTSPNAKADQWRVDALYHFGRDSDYISPFVSAGVGHARFDYFSGPKVSETLGNVGVGAKVSLSDAMAFRTDFKIFRGGETNGDDFALIFSLHYAIGNLRSNRSSANPAPVAALAEPIDSDGDGVNDDADDCANTPRAVAVNSKGCPRDSDGDGIADYMDNCPGTTNRAASIDESGCYVRLEETVSVELDVKFDLDSADTRSGHRDEVRRVYRFMNEYPDTLVTIEGHTDNSGAADYNEELSQRRAEAIANMLVEHFDIDADRVTAIGYGEERPVASNETAEGRAQNRRVVAVIEATVERLEQN